MLRLKILCLFLLFFALPVIASEPSVLINEIAWMGTEISANDEWIELYNNTEGDIDLTGWKLTAADGSPEISLTGTIPADGYFLLERTDDESAPGATADQIYTGALGNTNEHLKLYDAANNSIDEINASDGWPDGDNATKQTLERASINGWQTSAEPGGTPKAKNSAVEPGEEETPTEKPATEDEPQSESQVTTDNLIKAEKGDIVITEVFPNPQGVDTKNEFIEIKNVSNKNIDLTDWKIANAARQSFIIPSLKMTPESMVVFYRPQTNLALNNGKDLIKLYSKSGLIISQAEYKKPAPEGLSWQNNYGDWQWGEISPGQDAIFENQILPTAIISGPKEAEVGQIITFDASDSFDPEDRDLGFFWNFGDGRKASGVTARQIYLQPGSYEVALNVTAGPSASTTETLKIKITGEKNPEPEATSTSTTTEELIGFTSIPLVFISEFLPNPEGADDEGEFIEIFNQENYSVNLAGWQFDDADGGSKPYVIPDGTIIKPGQYLAFGRPQTKIALNNSDEAVRLFAPDGTLIDYTDYEESKEGKSFVLDERFVWRQSNTPTPGEINVLDEGPESEVSEKESEEAKPEVLGAETKGEIIESTPKNKNKYIFSALSAAVIIGIGGFLKIKKR